MPFPNPQTPPVSAPETPSPATSLPTVQNDAEQLCRITDAAPLLLSYIDADLRYRFLNRTYSQWFGQSQEQMLGQRVPEVVGQAAFEKVRRYLEAALGGTPTVYEGQMPYEDRQRYVQTSLVPDRDDVTGQVRGMVAVVTDITDRRLAEEMLAESEARYRSLFEHNKDAVYSFASDGTFVSANAACEQLTGFSAAELMQMNFAPLIVPEDREQVLGYFTRALRGETESYETAMLYRDGHRIEISVTNSPIIVAGEIVGVYGIARDITEQKQSAQLLAEASQKQRRFVREMLYSMTEGRLRLCDSPDDLPPPLPAFGSALPLSRPTLRDFRRQVSQATEAAHMDDERAQDFMTAIGEASMNAVVHAGGGEGQVCADFTEGVVQVWVRDAGTGINEDALHRATLEKGYTTAGTLGHGFWMMLKTADRVFLLTGHEGTTVVLEQERQLPDPLWMRTK